MDSPPPGLKSSSFGAGTLILGAVTGVREITRAQLLLGDGLGFYAFPDEVLLQWGPKSEPFQTGLTGKGENFLQMLAAMEANPQVWDHQQEMVAALKQLDPSIKSVELRMPNRDMIIVSHDAGGLLLPLELSYESEGFRRLLAHLIAIYQTPPKQTLFFEEPERASILGPSKYSPRNLKPVQSRIVVRLS